MYDDIDRLYRRKRKRMMSCDFWGTLSEKHTVKQESDSSLLGDAFYEKLHEMLLFSSLPGGRSRN